MTKAFTSFHVIVGILLFGIFSIMQTMHHLILTNLRKDKSSSKEIKSDTEKYYGEPKGLLFKYVDSPHYFCEVIIYVSFLVVCNGGFPLQ